MPITISLCSGGFRREVGEEEVSGVVSQASEVLCESNNDSEEEP
jgi:hypothetical protein